MDSRVARQTGLLYLGVAVTGLFGFLLIRPRLFADGDPAATLANLTQYESLARAGVALELGIVFTQALAAVWFFRLFRRVEPVAAGTIAAFGLVNAVAVLTSTALLATAVEVATRASAAVGAADTVQTLYLVSGGLWGAGSLFFGLWLVPMGICALRAGLPRTLGWLLVVGGTGYVTSAFVAILVPGAQAVADALTVPASVAEFWMIGYLLIRGARTSSKNLYPVPAH